ncbi:MAG: glycoside hydrolase family 3 C-terminal domain-containing protein [Clostridia bacterium]|nr:glycoside hydrolase family 3 C-terminal domain-containing protein [Clostridia bacterium]
MEKYRNKTLSDAERAHDLICRMTLEEKIFQLCTQIIFDVKGEEYKNKRDYRLGSFRNPGHFMHWKDKKTSPPSEVARFINEDVGRSVEASRFGIPALENGEALHGAQWGMATCFPQPIALAATFDPGLVADVADIIGKEVAAAGVRQVFAPVVNVSRDCRWGRTMETFGEDVLLCSDMGEAMCRGFQNNGVIATPKHFVDNYADGGRDSNESHSSQRTLYEVFLPPFRRCIEKGGAMSVMAAYNAVDGVPCSCSRRLLTDILRGEWGFDGFVVSDYNGVPDVCSAHHVTDSAAKAVALCIKAGLDAPLPNSCENEIKEALDLGYLTEEDIDRAAYRVIKTKIAIGLYDDPYVNEETIDSLVRCEKHKEAALKAARECMVLLKNEGVLPFDASKIRSVGVFGQGAYGVPIGDNYSGPYQGWRADDAHTPLSYLREFFKDKVKIVTGGDGEIETLAPDCDICLYFTKILEGEGRDRCNIRLTREKRVYEAARSGGMAVELAKASEGADQESAITAMVRANRSSAVILLNGAPIDMTGWIENVPAVLEAWYPGEQGAQAIWETVFGTVNPSGKLPVSMPKSVGQLPLCYSYKPSGRGYHYNENDGMPLFEFGFGLSYTEFSVENTEFSAENGVLFVEYDITNKGKYKGAEVVQIYLEGRNCGVVRPISELKAYKKTFLCPGETKREKITLDTEAFSFYDADLHYGVFDCDYTVKLGVSSNRILQSRDISVRDGAILI